MRTNSADQIDKKWVREALGTPTHSLEHAPCETLVCRCAVVVSRSLPPQSPVLLTPPIASNFLTAPPQLTDACRIGRGHGVIYPPPDSQELEPRMLPPYGHDVSPRSLCFSPLDMPHYLFTLACRVVDTLANGVDNGHGKGPWDDITGVVKQAVVDTSSCLCRHCERIRANSSSRRLYGWASMGAHHRPREIQSEYWSTG